MCEEYFLFEFLEDDAFQQKNEEKIQRKRLREHCNPFEVLNDDQFLERYCLSKGLVRNLCDELRPYLSEPTKSTDLSVETKVLVAIAFYTSGCYQQPTGDIASHAVSQSSVSHIIRQITRLLNLPSIQAKYVKFPQTSQEFKNNFASFYKKFGMPGVLGCIDCTHIAIIRPADGANRYFCGKQYHSLNVQLICNSDMEIINIDARHGGAIHKSEIWNNNPIKQCLKELNENESMCLFGDSGYPLSHYLMTPITNASPDSQEALYNEVHTRTLNVMKSTIGLLKARFRCLLANRVLRYSPQAAASIVNACVVLHNMCIRSNLPVLTLSEEEEKQEATLQVMDNTETSQEDFNEQEDNLQHLNNDFMKGLVAREKLVSRKWASTDMS